MEIICNDDISIFIEKEILKNNCKYFQDLFSDKYLEKKDDISKITLEYIDSILFSSFKALFETSKCNFGYHDIEIVWNIVDILGICIQKQKIIYKHYKTLIEDWSRNGCLCLLDLYNLFCIDVLRKYMGCILLQLYIEESLACCKIEFISENSNNPNINWEYLLLSFSISDFELALNYKSEMLAKWNYIKNTIKNNYYGVDENSYRYFYRYFDEFDKNKIIFKFTYDNDEDDDKDDNKSLKYVSNDPNLMFFMIYNKCALFFNITLPNGDIVPEDMIKKYELYNYPFNLKGYSKNNIQKIKSSCSKTNIIKNENLFCSNNTICLLLPKNSISIKGLIENIESNYGKIIRYSYFLSNSSKEEYFGYNLCGIIDNFPVNKICQPEIGKNRYKNFIIFEFEKYYNAVKFVMSNNNRNISFLASDKKLSWPELNYKNKESKTNIKNIILDNHKNKNFDENTFYILKNKNKEFDHDYDNDLDIQHYLEDKFQRNIICYEETNKFVIFKLREYRHEIDSLIKDKKLIRANKLKKITKWSKRSYIFEELIL
jgi:hypothetical protein